MQYKLYRVSPNVLTKTSGQINTYTIAATLIIVSFIFILIFIPGWISLITSTLFIPIALYWLKTHYAKKPLYLSVTESEITYFSDEKNGTVTILAEDIEKIKTSFCRLEILDKEETLHSINLMYIKSPQTRWEIKEITKRMITGN